MEERTGMALMLLSATEVWDRVDPLGADLGADPVRSGLAELPYELLMGPPSLVGARADLPYISG
jgi:hypothetical protein